MAHFIVQLPDGRKGDVRKGTISRNGLSKLFAKPFLHEKRIGYIVHIESQGKQQKEYRLLKSREGSWLGETVAGFGGNNEDEVCIQIREAIDEHEKWLR